MADPIHNKWKRKKWKKPTKNNQPTLIHKQARFSLQTLHKCSCSSPVNKQAMKSNHYLTAQSIWPPGYTDVFEGFLSVLDSVHFADILNSAIFTWKELHLKIIIYFKCSYFCLFKCKLFVAIYFLLLRRSVQAWKPHATLVPFHFTCHLCPCKQCLNLHRQNENYSAEIKKIQP